ncbi:MAG: cytochrome b/b6 domain-containing protein [Pseudomonadota bacterium]|nr:cytochrome b/b6 domain-containing protein [Pseudomonadota bacterium]
MKTVDTSYPDLACDLHGYPLIVRVTHWCTALAVILLIGSGWRIYDQEPVAGFAYFIPLWATLGGEPSHSLAINGETGFANALMWHFAAACLLLASFPVSLLHGLISGRFWRHWLPISPGAVARDAAAAVTFRLRHRRGHYNAVQRLLYVLVAFALLAMLASGLAIWKPVQLWWLTALFGGFQSARLVHFLGMAGIALFVAVHVLMALMVPRAIQAMITGHASL